MRITAELSLYPLNESFVGDINDFIQSLRTAENLEVITNQLSTQIRGSFETVTGAVNRCLRQSMEKPGTMVLVVKYVNADLDIGTVPTGI